MVGFEFLSNKLVDKCQRKFLHFSLTWAENDSSGYFVFFMKLCVARTFLVTLHLDDVLGVLRVLGLKFIFYKSFR